MEKLNKYNSFLLVLTALITWSHLLFNGDNAWYVKESMHSSALFLNSIVIYNLTRRRHYKIQQLGTLYLCFWLTRLVFHFVDRILYLYGVDIEKINLIVGMPIFFIFFVVAYFIMRELEKQWNKRTETENKSQ